MKTFAIILGVIGAIVATAGLYNMATSQTNQGVPEHVREMFTNWKSHHQKGYGASAEESYRLQVFYQNYNKINGLNAKGGARFALNDFADLSIDEFKNRYMGYKHSTGPRENVKSLKGLEVPQNVDWVADGAVNTPQKQHDCGGCYTFSSSGALEGLTFIKTGELLNFSKQQIIDCSQKYGNSGCGGGNFAETFEYTKDHGLVEEAQYPYMNADGFKCNTSVEAQGYETNTGYVEVPTKDNKELMAALSRQPVGVAVDADDIMFYEGGVFTNDCATDLNHAILAVGYGVDKETGKSFYKIKNSWGEKWGEGGFIRLERTEEDGEGKCGVLIQPVYPTI